MCVLRGICKIRPRTHLTHATGRLDKSLSTGRPQLLTGRSGVRSVWTGRSEQVSLHTGWPGQVGLERSVWTIWSEEVSLNRMVRTGQFEQVGINRPAWMVGLDRSFSTGRSGQIGLVNLIK